MSLGGVFIQEVMICFNPRPPKRTLCPPSACCVDARPSLVSIHVLRRGRCITSSHVPPIQLYGVSIHVLRRGRCVFGGIVVLRHYAICFNPRPPKRTLCLTYSCPSLSLNKFQSTSSEEDVVSPIQWYFTSTRLRFNPRPPKRTLCLYSNPAAAADAMFQSTSSEEDVVSNVKWVITSIPKVSIHVLRRGRCVYLSLPVCSAVCCFNPRPPKRTLCLLVFTEPCVCGVFQSTSSEEDVVSTMGYESLRFLRVSIHVLRRGRYVRLRRYPGNQRSRFQSTSSEEDVVSRLAPGRVGLDPGFNPRPPKRTLCRTVSIIRGCIMCFNPRPPKRTLCLV